MTSALAMAQDVTYSISFPSFLFYSGDGVSGGLGRSGNNWCSVKPQPYSVTPASVVRTKHRHLDSTRVARLNAAVTIPASIFTFLLCSLLLPAVQPSASLLYPNLIPATSGFGRVHIDPAVQSGLLFFCSCWLSPLALHLYSAALSL